MSYLFLCFFLLLTSSCATIKVDTPHPDNIYHLSETGKGQYGVFLTLVDPGTGRFLPNTPYRLVVENVRMDPIYDVTDAMGRTKFVRTQRPPKAYVIETVGNGEFGKSFHLVYERSATPVGNTLYRVMREDGSVIEGVSDAEGNTKYIVSDRRENLTLEVLSGSWNTEWYGEKIGGPFTRLCAGPAYFRRCFKTTHQECSKTILHAMEQCRTDLQKEPHAPLPTSNNTADEWPVQFASCVVSEYFNQMSKRRKMKDNLLCQELAPGGPQGGED